MLVMMVLVTTNRNGKVELSMMKARAITAGAIALTLALGGGSLWTSQYANAATASVDKQLEQGTQTDKGAAKKSHSGKRGGFESGSEHIQEQLAAVLSLSSAELEAEQEAGKTIAAIAEENGVDIQTVIDALVSDQKVKLDEKLAAGSITQDQYDSKFARAVEHATQHVNGLLPQRGEGSKHHGYFGGSMEAIAEALGLTEDELKLEIEAGKTIADIAADKGVAVQALIDLQIKNKQAKLAEQLAAGTITQEQYDTRLADVSDQATKFVNGEFTAPDKGDDKRGHEGKGSRGERSAGAGVKDKSAADETADEE